MTMTMKDCTFYSVDYNYLKYLHSKDSEVSFDPSYETSIKPFIGILVTLNKYNYLVPLTSAKIVHAKLKNTGFDYFLIHELVEESLEISSHIYKKPMTNGYKFRLMALVDVKKMIPVPSNLLFPIKFDTLEPHYKDLFQKEYEFCLNKKDWLIKKANFIYDKQIATQQINFASCHYKLLEKAMNEYTI